MPGTYDVDLVKEFNAPLPRVWAAWTEPVEPLRRIRYVFNFADADGNRITPTEAGIPGDGIPADGEHEVVLTDLGDGRTMLHMTERGYGTQEARDLSQSGLLQCLDKMAALVEQIPPHS